MEAGYDEIEEEEYKSRKIGAIEDRREWQRIQEDEKLEKEERRRKKMLKR